MRGVKAIFVLVLPALFLLVTLDIQGKLSPDEPVATQSHFSKMMVLSKDIIRLETPGTGSWLVNLNSPSGKPVGERDILVSTFVDGKQVDSVAMSLPEVASFFAGKVTLSPEDHAKIGDILRQ